jgi:hypothetical protein
MTEREVRSIAYHIKAARFPAKNEPAPREGVLDWRGMWGFEIAI